MKKEDLKIVFLGTPEFAVESLSRLYNEGYNIAGVITMPDKPAGRGHKMLQSPVKQFAVEHGLKLMQPTNLKAPEFIEELRSLDADLFIVIAFRMLPEAVWTMPRLGTFNLHASLLPKYRGAAPLNWAVINGDKETGVTTFFLKHEIDTGDIIDQKRVAINPDDNVGDIHDRLMMLGADLTLETVRHIIDGNLKTIEQDKLTGGVDPTPAPKIFKETCLIDWNNNAEKVHNLVRGLSPYPAAWTTLTTASGDELQLKIFKTSVSGQTTLAPGSIVIDKDRMYIACNDRLLEILSLQLQGKKRLDTADFLRGFNPDNFKL
ncbi:MAG TPA: methionyl-tRNA formyltransferase [Muribaculum sp.]|jgi:methionyl-tRNA formyltransferase|uniref:Methionyl-tRNA formyltransferase n=1 Tax=Heminiphilus faecis TaxID=2601703 RepID=A0ABV4CRM2_9BACT|nr:methionyl-tRNA formyltransferase [Heminiphilus faecis]RLT78016.1 methionyl-tRNA formyltransferase [bacterium J10(2018)]HRF68117.1 methionyl-tRNA formyltransferase [Muribaculum sp.]